MESELHPYDGVERRLRVVLRRADGSEEVFEVASLGVELGAWKLEVAPGAEPLVVHMHVPVAGETSCSFVVHHLCANSMGVELRPNV
jgi:hypothetical protein